MAEMEGVKSMSDNTQAQKNKLFVGNLPFSTTEEQLQEMFSEYGEIASVQLITDRQTGRSRGFAFVEYTNEEDAQKAIEAMDQQELEGRTIAVNVARPRRPRRDYNNRSGYGGGNRGGYNRNRGGYDRNN